MRSCVPLLTKRCSLKYLKNNKGPNKLTISRITIQTTFGWIWIMLPLVSLPTNILAKPTRRCLPSEIKIEKKSNCPCNDSFLDRFHSQYDSGKGLSIQIVNVMLANFDFKWDSDLDDIIFPSVIPVEYDNFDEHEHIPLVQEIDLVPEPILIESYVHCVQQYALSNILHVNKIKWNVVKFACIEASEVLAVKFNKDAMENYHDNEIYRHYQSLFQRERKYDSIDGFIHFISDIPEIIRIEDISIANEPCFCFEEIVGSIASELVILANENTGEMNFNFADLFESIGLNWATTEIQICDENIYDDLLEILDQTKILSNSCPFDDREAFLNLEVFVDENAGVFQNHEEIFFNCWDEIPWPIEILSWDSFRKLLQNSFAPLFPAFSVEYVYNDFNWSKQYIQTSWNILYPTELLSVTDRPLKWILSHYWPTICEATTLHYSRIIYDSEFSPTATKELNKDSEKVHEIVLNLNEFIDAALEEPREISKMVERRNENIPAQDERYASNYLLDSTSLPSSHFSAKRNFSIKSQHENFVTPDYQAFLLKMDNALDTSNNVNSTVIPASTVLSPKNEVEFSNLNQANISKTISQLDGQQNCIILMSENIFEKYYFIIPYLQSQFNISCFDYPFRDAADIVISEITCIKLLEDINMLKQENCKRNIIKALCDLTTKFSLIWLLVNSTHQQIDNVSEAMVSLSQSFMRFPSRVIIRHYTDTTLPNVISSVYHDDVAISQRDPRLLSQYYDRHYCQKLLESPEISATCDFLQQYPSINVYLAVLLVTSFSSLKEIAQATPEEMKQRLQIMCPTTKMEYLMPNFVTLAILLRCNIH